MDDLLPSSYPSSFSSGSSSSLPASLRLASPSSFYSSSSYSNSTLAAAAAGDYLKTWLESLEAALVLGKERGREGGMEQRRNVVLVLFLAHTCRSIRLTVVNSPLPPSLLSSLPPH